MTHFFCHLLLIGGCCSLALSMPAQQLCQTPIVLHAATVAGTPLKGWQYQVQPAQEQPYACAIRGATDSSAAQVCLCRPAGEMHEVWLSRADSSLADLDVLDIVLIQQHLIGEHPPGFPELQGWPLYVADVRGDGYITSLDVMQMREVMLGRKKSDADFPAWRFLPQHRALGFVGNPAPLLSDPEMPGHGRSEGFINSNNKARFRAPDSSFTRPLHFTGFRMGDVSAAFAFARTAPVRLGMPAGAGACGDTLELPLMALYPLNLMGWQGTLRFDTSLVELLDVFWANARTQGSATQREWQLAAPGECRLVWHNALRAQSWLAAEPLLWVQLRLRRDLPQPQPLLQRADGPLPALVLGSRAEWSDWLLQDTVLAPLPARCEAPLYPPRPLAFRVYPNPAEQHFRIEAEAPEAQEARLTALDDKGNTWLDQPWSLKAGLNVLPGRTLPPIGPGRYVLQLSTAAAVHTIYFTKK